jgi:hypothetical protein
VVVVSGRHVQLRVRKKTGKEAEDVLDPDAGKSVWDKLWSGKPGPVSLFTTACECNALHSTGSWIPALAASAIRDRACSKPDRMNLKTV